MMADIRAYASILKSKAVINMLLNTKRSAPHSGKVCDVILRLTGTIRLQML